MSDKVAQTHIYRADGVYFVSTINRNSSAALAPDMRYAETMAWGPASTNHLGVVGWPDGRGPLVFQDSAAEGSLVGHLYVCRMIHEHGDKAEEASRDFADALLAAAGEKEDPATHEDCVSVAIHNAVMDRLQVDFDALKRERDALRVEIEVHHPAVCAKYEAEIAALKRILAGDLTDAEGQAAWDLWDGTGKPGADSMQARDRAIMVIREMRADAMLAALGKEASRDDA